MRARLASKAEKVGLDLTLIKWTNQHRLVSAFCWSVRDGEGEEEEEVEEEEGCFRVYNHVSVGFGINSNSINFANGEGSDCGADVF